MVPIASPTTGERLARPGAPTKRGVGAAAHRAVPAAVPPVWRELLLVVVFYSVYSLTRTVLNRPGGTRAAFRHAHDVLGLERLLGLDMELPLNRALLHSEHLALAANLFYLSAHFAVTLAVLVWLYRSRPAHYVWLRTGIVVATGLALLGFWLFPLAPPRFLAEAGFVDPVVRFHTPGLYSSGASAAMANQYAAMPSMHAGWAVWCGLALALLGRRWWTRLLGVLYPLTTLLVILATANHYLVDAVAGIALIAVSLAVTPLIRRFRRRPAR